MNPPSGQKSGEMLEELHRLRRAVEELSILNDLARAIGASVNSQEIMRTIVHRSLKAIGAEQGVITLVDSQATDPMKTLVRTAVSSAQYSPYHFHQALLGWMYLNKKPLMMNDPARDERFRGATWDESIRSLLCVPMMVKAELKGVLTVYNKKGDGQFTEEDQRLLAIIAAQSAQVVENARLLESEQALFQMKEELRLASRIQADLLPNEAPQVPGYDIAGKSLAAQIVGGDYFDFIPMADHRIAICLGDVSGKGLPASLLMANVQATLRGQTLLATCARECIERSNRLLYLSTSSEKFVTLFYGMLDAVEHTLCFTNAGHENPFLLSTQNVVQRLSEGGLVLSILEEFPYKEAKVDLAPGDILVAFTDGITEAINPNQEQFGEARLAALIEKHRAEPAAELVESIIRGVREHAAGAPQMDDITLLVVKRLHGGEAPPPASRPV
jgi:sigma-B regulation protein RsbU (phosphoserine phosphatase)